MIPLGIRAVRRHLVLATCEVELTPPAPALRSFFPAAWRAPTALVRVAGSGAVVAVLAETTGAVVHLYEPLPPRPAPLDLPPDPTSHGWSTWARLPL